MALTSDRKFASVSESRAAAVERQAVVALKRKRREGLARANPDANVFMSAAMRRRLETALGLTHIEVCDKQTDRQADGQTDGRMDGQTDGKKNLGKVITVISC